MQTMHPNFFRGKKKEGRKNIIIGERVQKHVNKYAYYIQGKVNIDNYACIIDINYIVYN